MSQQELINTLIAVVGAGGGWWINTIWGMVKMQQKEISTLHIKLAENYVPRAELAATLGRMQDTLDEIRDLYRTEMVRR